MKLMEESRKKITVARLTENLNWWKRIDGKEKEKSETRAV